MATANQSKAQPPQRSRTALGAHGDVEPKLQQASISSRGPFQGEKRKRAAETRARDGRKKRQSVPIGDDDGSSEDIGSLQEGASPDAIAGSGQDVPSRGRDQGAASETEADLGALAKGDVLEIVAVEKGTDRKLGSYFVEVDGLHCPGAILVLLVS